MVTIINGTAGIDTIIGDLLNAEKIYGFDGDDILKGYAGDTLFGGLGDDTLYALGFGVKLVGGKGNDTIYGYVDPDPEGHGHYHAYYGGVGNDTIYGGGTGHMYGGQGADILSGGFANYDYINEKGGLPTSGITVNLVTGTASDGDTLIDIKGVYTTQFDDVVTGNSSETIWLGAGNDISYGGGFVDGGDGNDQLYGAGRMYGGNGNDVILGGGLLDGGDGNDMITGSAADDTIISGGGDDIAYGGKGNDTLGAGSGIDKLYGGEGNDTFYGITAGHFFYGGSGIDTIALDNSGFSTNVTTVNLSTQTSTNGLVFSGIEGLDASDSQNNFILTGNASANTLIAGHGDTTLNGLGGNDTLIAKGWGDIILNGGAGNDILNVEAIDFAYHTLTGGAGADTFIIEAATGCGFIGQEYIKDFSTTSGDVIKVTNFNDTTATDFDYLKSHMVQNGNNVSIDLYFDDQGEGYNIVIENIQISALTSDDFAFI